MGLLDSLFGGSDDKKTVSGSSQTLTEAAKTEAQQNKQTQEQRTTSTGSAQQLGTQTGTQLLFSPEVEATLNSLFQKIAGSAGATGLTNAFSLNPKVAAASDELQGFASGQASRAGQAPVNTEDLVAKSRAAATQQYQEGTAANISQYADSVGSAGGNSTVQLLKQKGLRDLAIAQGGQEASIRLEAENAEQVRQKAALDALIASSTGLQSYEAGGTAAGSQALLGLIEQIKGGRATTIGQTATTGVTKADTASTEVLNQLVKSILGLKQEEDVVSSGKEKTSSSGSLLNLLGVLGGNDHG